MPVNRQSSRRPRLTRYHNDKFSAADETGLPGRTRWLQCLLDMYVEEPDVAAPMLGEDGEPVKDQFGGLIETADKRFLLVRDGWMTKSLLVTGWYAVFGESYLMADYPEHYERTHDPESPDARIRRINQDRDGIGIVRIDRANPKAYDRPHALVSYAHPMDHHLTEMIRKGEMLKQPGRKNRYFPAKHVCEGEAVNRPDAFAMFELRSAIADMNPTKAIHQNEPGWARVLAKMERYVACDFTRIIRLAEKEYNANMEPLFAEGADKENIVRIHISRWLAAGRIVRVTKHMYRTTGVVYKARGYDWRKISPLHWMDKLILRAYGEYVGDPEWTFTFAEVVEWYREYVAESTIKQAFYAAARGEDRFFDRYGESGHFRLSARMISALNHHAIETAPVKVPEKEPTIVVSKQLARLRAKGIGLPRD